MTTHHVKDAVPVSGDGGAVRAGAQAGNAMHAVRGAWLLGN